ncbi:hypothetical protein FACS1894199_12490 [Bacteroidia bacterium]|nr:hypothetical protein FACS1894199_12490 [Bacteroidia bacterium]
MNYRKVFRAVLCVLVAGMVFMGCSDDDKVTRNDGGSLIDLPDARVFILNEGSWGGNNAGITFYESLDGSHDIIGDIYLQQNGKGLGDVGQSIVNDTSNIYVVVSESKRITKLNQAGVEQHTLSIPTNFGNPRFAAIEGGKLYVTVYGYPGYVLRINTATMSIEDSVRVGNNPENIASCKGKLYVSNTEYGSGTTVSVVDISTFKEVQKVNVIANPNDILAVNNKVYVVSWGLYDEAIWGFHDYVLQRVDDGAAGAIGSELNLKVSKMAAHNDILYIVSRTNECFTYNTTTGTVKQESFLKGAPATLSASTVYMLTINPYNGEFYVGTNDYVNNGTIYRFSSDGTFMTEFESGGIGPCGAVFFK